MKTTKTIEITLSAKEIEDIIKKYLLEKEKIKIDKVCFKVETVYDDGDWRAEYPPSHCFSEAECSGELE